MAAKKTKSFSEKDLTAQQLLDFKHAKTRIHEMQKYREQSHYGVTLESLWADADNAYIPHRIKSKGKRVVAEDETKGWRGALVNLGDTDWQSDIAQANPFVKIQTALSVLVDQNPTGVFTATTRKYQATTELMKQLYQRSWEYARSKGQLKLFVHNLAKYGWAVGRTYPLRIARKTKVLTEYNPEDPEASVYEEKEAVEFNDVMRENLDPRNTWIDDMTRPNSQFSMRDWCWRKVYTMDAFKEEFGAYKRCELVQPGGITTETVTGKKTVEQEKVDTNLVEVYFYESRLKDLFMVIANGVPVCIAPLPISDANGIKKLSIWQTYWNIRHALSPYGIGIYEAIRYDQAFLDRIRNMTIDQITMSIYKMFFYQGTQSLTDTGDIKISPGVGKQVLNPKDINWLEVPGPGKDAYEGIAMFQKGVDEASGITEPLLGEVTGKTAFEIAQAKEAAIKRLKTPLDNILDALNDEGYITVSLMQILYSIPEVYVIGDPLLIEDYLKETGSDPDLYERAPDSYDEEGNAVPGAFTAKVYPEFPLNLEKDEKGNLIETKDSQFFRIKPSGLKWEGVINIKAQSVLSPSKQIDKALELEMYNMLIPLMAATAQERMMLLQTGQPTDMDNLTNGKTIKSIIKLYDKDPRDIVPTDWLGDQQAQAAQQPLFIQPGAEGMAPSTPQMGATEAPTQGPTPSLPTEPSSIVGNVMSKIT